MATSQTLGSMKNSAAKARAMPVEKVSAALKHASSQAQKQLDLQGLELPTQSWSGSSVRNPVVG